MPQHPPIDLFSSTGQCMAMILAALYEKRAILTKQETIEHIQRQCWFDLQPGDWNPYETQTEPRWHSMIAWARLAAVHREFMLHHDESDHWEISRKGIDKMEELKQKFSRGELEVRRGYLWSRAFKRWLCPTYEPSDKDARRPGDIDDFI